MSKLGIKCGAYVNTASWVSPTWVEITCIENWQQNFDWDKASSDSRAAFIKTEVKTMASLSYSGRLKKLVGDDVYALLKTSLLAADSPLDLLILDGKKNVEGSEGFRGWFHIFSANEDQGLGTRLYEDVTIGPADPADSTQVIQYATVGASPGFTIDFSDIPNDAA